MKTPDQFFGEWDGKGIDFDGFYGFQCVDLYQQYNKECVGGAVLHGNAVDFWNNFDHSHYYQIPNTPTNAPIKGDVVIWSQGVGVNGHIAVAKDGNTNSFTSFDQNWPVGSLCHFQPHSYKYVLGWLRPGKEPVPEQPPAPVESPSTSPSAPPAPSIPESTIPTPPVETSPPPVQNQPWYTILWRWLKGILRL